MFLFWLRRSSTPIAETAPRRPYRRRTRPRSYPLSLERLGERCLPSVFTVTTTADSGAGSLRQAILDANASPGLDTIAFAIGSGVQTVQPASALPAVTDPAVIDGTTQPGFAGTPVIVLDGSPLPERNPLGAGTPALVLQGGGSTVKGLVIDNFPGPALELPSNNNVVQGNYVGTDVTGTLARGNGQVAIGITGSNNTVGGTTAGAGNVISGNLGQGLSIGLLPDVLPPSPAPPVTGNVVQGNLIGTDATGRVVLANTGDGIRFEGIRQDIDISGNTIGGTVPGARNVVSGNHNGITISIEDALSSGNVVQGNYIGTDITGTFALGNGPGGRGVIIQQGSHDTVGGTAPGARNVISGHSDFGIIAGSFGSVGNVVQGNYVGTDVTGTKALGNGLGGIVDEGSLNTLGGTAAGAGNLVSGNGVGIELRSQLTVVQGNFIGTDATGTRALGNATAGLMVNGSDNTVGGTTSGARNLISGNLQDGVDLLRTVVNVTGTVVQGNYVGTDVTGTAALPNGNDGIELTPGAANNTVGGTAAGAGNLLAGNGRFGVFLSSTSGNVLQGNTIGLGATGAALGNAFDGVALWNGANGNTVGGTVPGAGNTIAANGRFGVLLNGNGTRGGVTGNVVQGNRIGTDAGNTPGLGNANDGVVLLFGADGNTLGGTAPGAGNVIGSSGQSGVVLVDADGNLLAGNAIGVSPAGAAPTTALPNAVDGVGVANSVNNVLGAPGAANVISGNGRYGVLLNFASTTGNVLQGNVVGSDAAGTAALGNGADGVAVLGAPGNTVGGIASGAGNLLAANGRFGVFLDGSGAVVQGNLIGTNGVGAGGLGNADDGIGVVTANNTVGGTAAGAGNVISGNQRYGVLLLGTGATGNVLQGNTIGLASGGLTPRPNTFDGVALYAGASGNTLGGTAAGAGNTIAGNGRFGAFLMTSGTSGNLLQGNFVGTDATGTLLLGNTAAGVALGVGAAGNTVGGTAAGAGNAIAFNGGAGVLIGFGAGDTATVGDAVLGNRISRNTGLGIDLGNNGPTPNNSGPNGPNHFQNHPVLTSVSPVSNNSVTVTFTFTSLAGSTFRLEFFLNPVTDVSAQGRTFLGAVSAATDATGDVAANGVTALTPGVSGITVDTATTPHTVTLTLAVPPGTVAGSLTATATALTVGTGQPGTSGDSSEFSPGVLFPPT